MRKVFEIGGKKVWGAWEDDTTVVLTVAGTTLRAETVKATGKITSEGKTYQVANALDPWAGKKHPNTGKHIEVYLAGGVGGREAEGGAPVERRTAEIG